MPKSIRNRESSSVLTPLPRSRPAEIPEDAQEQYNILVINCGSSSVKFALFSTQTDEPRRCYSGAVQRIGMTNSRFVVTDGTGTTRVDETRAVDDHGSALDLILDWIDKPTGQLGSLAVGHRVVHGGEECDCPLAVSPELEARLESLVPLAPLHLPHNLAGIRAIRDRLPNVPQIACFDTAFHQTLPHIARLTGLPRRFADEGVLRYGFHGLSYEYVMENVRQRYGEKAARGRIIIAHLGNGASMAAIKDGRSIDTTMGFTTLAGLPMGTRCGDLDPGILLFLLMTKGITADELQDILYKESGLLGISGLSRNMADLLAQRNTPAANEAIEYFCYQARKYLVGSTAALGGVDRVIFTGGIGGNAPEIRSAIISGLDYLGLTLHPERNRENLPVISEDNSPVRLEVVQTDEELVIARHVKEFLDMRAVSHKDKAHG